MRTLRSLFWIVALAVLAVPVGAQTAVGVPPPEGAGACFCGTSLQGASVCWQDEFCAVAPTCGPANPCAPGFQCIVNTCCGVPVCLATNCAGGTACVNPGVCNSFAPCVFSVTQIPTLNYVGLATLLAALVGLSLFVLRRHRRAAAA